MARKKKRRVGRPRKKKRTSSRQRAVRGLANIPTSKLRDELERRSEQLGQLEQRRDELAAQLNEIDTELEAIGARPSGGAAPKRGPGRPPGRPRGRPPGRPRGRPPGRPKGSRRRYSNKASLVDALAKTLQSKTMSVSDAADQVQKEGYKTTSPNFRTIVNQALLSNPKVFKKVSRGQYTAK